MARLRRFWMVGALILSTSLSASTLTCALIRNAGPCGADRTGGQPAMDGALDGASVLVKMGEAFGLSVENSHHSGSKLEGT